MTNLFETIQAIATDQFNKLLTLEIGKVTSTFPHSQEKDFDNYECNVEIAGLGGELRHVPVATPYIGMALIPNIGDLVLVAFVGGEINQPIIIGRLYNDQDRPPINKMDEIILHLPLHAKNNEAVNIEMRKGEGTRSREVLVELAPSVKLSLVDYQVLAQAGAMQLRMTQRKDKKGLITLQAGKSQLAINQDGDALIEVGKTKVALNLDNSVVVEAGKSRLTINEDGDILVESEGALDLKANGDLTMTATNINLKSDQATTIETGTDLSVKAGSSAALEAATTMDIKGATVDLN